jgi:1,4-dihydroxy-2-naphthoyl-CoA hydrolase
MTIWKQPIELSTLQELASKSGGHYLGLEVTEIGDDFLKGRMPVSERTQQPMGLLHGGFSCVLIETIASIAAHYCVDEGNYCVGQEINANHLRPVSEGTVSCIVRPAFLGRKSQVWTAELHSEEGKLICVGRITMAVIQPSMLKTVAPSD